MGALLPTALGALLLAALPVLLHLLRRERVEERSFPALRYLAPETLRRRRSYRLREWLLLALRVGAVVVLALGAARLVVPVGEGSLPPADLVVVVDAGLASGAVVEGRRVLDAQEALLREVEEALGPLDRIHVLTAGGGGEAAETLESVVLRGARAMALRDAGPRALLVIRPDGKRLDPGWVEDHVAPLGIEPREVDPGLPFPPNRGITAVELGSGLLPREGESPELRVRVEGQAVEEEPVRLFLEEELVAMTRTDSSGWARLALPPLPAGDVSIRVELDPDALRADDGVEWVLAVRPPPPVGVRGAIGTPLATALQVLDEGNRITLEAPLPAGGGADLPWTEVATDQLLLLLPPADPTRLPAFQARLLELGFPGRLEPPTSGGAGTRVAPDPVLPSAVVGVEVRRYYPVSLAPEEEEGEALPFRGLLEDGSPWLVSWPEAVSGTPRTLRLLSFPLDPGWTDLPEAAGMVPLVDRLLAPEGAAPTSVAGGAHARVEPAPPRGPPGPRWVQGLVPGRGGMEATPFLAWLLFVIVCTEGWLAGGFRRRRDPTS